MVGGDSHNNKDLGCPSLFEYVVSPTVTVSTRLLATAGKKVNAFSKYTPNLLTTSAEGTGRSNRVRPLVLHRSCLDSSFGMVAIVRLSDNAHRSPP